MTRSRRGLLVLSAGVLLAGCSNDDSTTGTTDGASSTPTDSATRASPTDSSPTDGRPSAATNERPSTTTDDPPPTRFRSPAVQRSFGRRYVDGQTQVAFTVRRPRVTATVEVGDDTYRAGTNTVVVFVPVTFHNTDDEETSRIFGADVFRLVTKERIVDETDSVLGFELDRIDRVERARWWTVQGTRFDPGEGVDGVAAFQLAPPVDPSRVTVALDRRRLYRDDGDHGVVGWSSE